MDLSDELLTVGEVATYLRMSISTVYRLARQGRLPGQKIGGVWRFSRRHLAALVAEGGGGQAKGPPEARAGAKP